MRVSTSTGIVFAACSWALPAAAQTMTPTATQRSYNDRGVQHMFDGEFEEAAANFRSSLSLGESNIAWLNFGRSLFKLQRCHESRNAFGQVSSAPKVAAPSPTEIETVLERFEDEWGEACVGRLTLECPEEPAEVRLDGGEPFSCHEDEIPVIPGVHRVSIAEWDQSFAVEVGAEPTMLSLKRSLTPPPTDDVEPSPETLGSEAVMVAQAGGTRRIIGATLAVAGVAGLGTALAFEAAWVAPAFADYEAAETPTQWSRTREVVQRRQRVNRIVLFSSLGVTAIGTTLFLWPRRSGSDLALRLGLTGPTSVGAEVRW